MLKSFSGSFASSEDVDENADFWSDQLETCANSGVGSAVNVTYKTNGQALPAKAHPMEDQSFKIVHNLDRSQRSIRLYGVFDGFDDGKAVADFAAQKTIAEIILADDDSMNLERVKTDEEIKSVLLETFASVDRGYFNSIGDRIAKKMALEEQIGIKPIHEAERQTVDELGAINQELMGGATAIVALIIDNRLFIANAGDTRAILVQQDAEGQLAVQQLSRQHDTNDCDEQLRLSQLGFTEEDMKHFGVPYCTRCIGDYRRKIGYKDIERFAKASDEPIISEPDVQGGIPIEPSFIFLILMSSGVYMALEDSERILNEKPNPAIAERVLTEYSQQRTLNYVAQAAVDFVSRTHQEAFTDAGRPGPHREDMTLMVIKLNEPNSADTSTTSQPTSSGDVYFHSAESSMEDRLDGYNPGPAFELDSEGKIESYVKFNIDYNSPEWKRAEAEIQEIRNEYLKASGPIPEEDEAEDEVARPSTTVTTTTTQQVSTIRESTSGENTIEGPL